MKCFLGISNFLEELSSLSHSVVFLYFFALITEEGFLISPGYSLELCILIGLDDGLFLNQNYNHVFVNVSVEPKFWLVEVVSMGCSQLLIL